MSFRSALVAATAFLAAANAHITMEKPVPYSLDKLDNSPITAEQYPCKSQNGFTVSTMNQMKVGDKQTISFKGTAVHGGGSCQLSYTQDTSPTKDSKFKVIKSIEGGCPGVSGSTNTYDFTLPDSIPNGKGTFAWTWFSKLSGAPELYMNCAPIDVSGGASDAAKLDALPDMLVANIASTTCKSPLNKAIKFPSPGSEVQAGGTNDAEAPTGSCGASSGGGSTPASSGAAQPSSAPSSAAAPGGGATSAAGGGATSAVGGGASSPATSAAVPSNTGGVFAPGASSAAGGASSVAGGASSAAGGASSAAGGVPTSTQTTLQTVTASTPAGTGGATSPTGAPASGGSTCSNNGAVVCNGTDQFGICNNGNVVWQAVAAGTTCSNGTIQKRGYNGRVVRPRAVVPGKDFTPDN